MKMEYAVQDRTKITTIWSQPGAKEDQICRALKDSSKQGKTYYLYIGNTTIWEKIQRLWRTEQIGMYRNIINCKMMVETIREPERQLEVKLAYHQGKTNHRGDQKTLQALKRRYYWRGMIKTIKEVITACEVCQATKYDRHPPKGMQEETPHGNGSPNRPAG